MLCTTFYLALAIMMHNGWVPDGLNRYHHDRIMAPTEYVEVVPMPGCHVRLRRLFAPGVAV